MTLLVIMNGDMGSRVDNQFDKLAVDLFLSGKIRTMVQGAKIGVHAWSDGSSSANDYPNNHTEHEVYINFYKDIGYSQQEAENLYFLSLTLLHQKIFTG